MKDTRLTVTGFDDGIDVKAQSLEPTDKADVVFTQCRTSSDDGDEI